jgi:hypothetical protein
MKKDWLNQLKYFKKYSVWFVFDFVSLKPKNWIESEKTEPNRKNQTKPKPNPLEKSKKPPKNNIVFGF